MRAMRTKS